MTSIANEVSCGDYVSACDDSTKLRLVKKLVNKIDLFRLC